MDANEITLKTLPSWLKPLKDYPGYYVSSSGRIWSNKGRRGFRIREGSLNRSGYLRVIVFKGRIFKLNLARTVAEHFIPNPLNLPEVDHKDRNKLNNFYRNLRWVTKTQNVLNKEMPKGEHHLNARLTPEDIKAIRTRNLSVKAAAEHYGVSSSNVRKILKNQSWTHIL